MKLDHEYSPIENSTKKNSTCSILLLSIGILNGLIIGSISTLYLTTKIDQSTLNKIQFQLFNYSHQSPISRDLFNSEIRLGEYDEFEFDETLFEKMLNRNPGIFKRQVNCIPTNDTVIVPILNNTATIIPIANVTVPTIDNSTIIIPVVNNTISITNITAIVPIINSTVPIINSTVPIIPIIPTLYSAIVSFGDSWSDSAHPRPSWEYNTLRHDGTVPYGGGRSSNGKLAVEYLATTSIAKGSSASQYNYALGSTLIDNSLGNNPFPSTADQINLYLADLINSNSNVTLGDGRILHTYLSGLNPMFQIFTSVWNGPGGISNTTTLTNALARVTANADAIGNQMNSLQSNPTLRNSTSSADFLVMSLPPLHLNPFFWLYCNGNNQGVTFLQTMTTTFNSVLATRINALTPIVAAKGGKMIYFDLTSFLTVMSIGNPGAYSFDKVPAWVFQPCWNGNSACALPDNYMWWDTLHLTTKAHSFIANALAVILTV